MTYRRLASCLLTCAMLAGCATFDELAGPPQPGAKGLQTVAGVSLPKSFADWRLAGEVQRYTAENLYEHINGEADLYFPYRFQEAVAARYERGGEALNATVFTMGSALDGFGIYSNYRSASMQTLNVGAEAQASDYQFLFYEGPYFVRLSTSGAVADARAALETAARAIADVLPGSDQPPRELELLDIEGVDRRSVKYIAQSVLGYDFLPRGLQADANVDGKPLRVFLVMTDSPEQGAQTYDAYKAYLAAKDASFREHLLPGRRELQAQDPLHKSILVRQVASRLFGVASRDDAETGRPILLAMEEAAVPLR